MAWASQIIKNIIIIKKYIIKKYKNNKIIIIIHECVDKFRCVNGHANACQSRYIDDAKLGFSKILVIEFTETLKRGVLIDLPEHKFASSLSDDTGNVNFDFDHVEPQFRVVSKPLANLNQYLEGFFESGINVRVICETNPASTAMAGEYSTPAETN